MTTTEQDRAQMEAERNAADAKYFTTNPSSTMPMMRNLQKGFIDGYERGWNERNKKVIELQARIDSLQEQLEQLAD